MGDWLDYYLPPRWHPTGLTVAAMWSPGVYVERFRYSHTPDRMKSAGMLFGRRRRMPKIYAYGYRPVVAWSPDGVSMLFEAYAGLVRVDLKTGRRRTVIARLWLGAPPKSEGSGSTAGLDWSLDRRRIAYSLRGTAQGVAGRWDPEETDAPDSGLIYEVWWAAPNGMGRRRLGTGSRPRFSPDGQWLVALDRLPSVAGTGLRLYDLRGPHPNSRIIIEHALAACFARDSKRLAVVLQNGDLVLADLSGRIVRRLQSGRKMLVDDVEYEEGVTFLGVRRADIDW